ncbi:MAG TPA: DMT family transporter [Methylomirabilota bacterium]|nr:DMT family transporter [Methylomirabilota bacterium]
MKFSTRHLAVIALIISNIVWGAAAPLFKWSLQDIPPFTLAFLRFALASLLILPLVYSRVTIRLQDIPKMILLALVGIVGHIGLFFLGVQLTASINAPIITTASPLFLILIAYFYLHEKLQKRVLIGTLLSLLGVSLLVVLPLIDQTNHGSIIGNFLLVISTLCFVFYTILLKKFNLNYPSLTVIFWVFFFGAFLFIPFMAAELPTITRHPFDIRAIVGILYGAFSSSILAYFCYNFGVRHLKANEVGIFFYLDPLTAIFVAQALLGEVITPLYIVSTLIVFAGIIISEHKLHYHGLR